MAVRRTRLDFEMRGTGVAGCIGLENGIDGSNGTTDTRKERSCIEGDDVVFQTVGAAADVRSGRAVGPIGTVIGLRIATQMIVTDGHRGRGVRSTETRNHERPHEAVVSGVNVSQLRTKRLRIKSHTETLTVRNADKRCSSIPLARLATRERRLRVHIISARRLGNGITASIEDHSRSERRGKEHSRKRGDRERWSVYRHGIHEKIDPRAPEIVLGLRTACGGVSGRTVPAGETCILRLEHLDGNPLSVQTDLPPACLRAIVRNDPDIQTTLHPKAVTLYGGDGGIFGHAHHGGVCVFITQDTDIPAICRSGQRQGETIGAEHEIWNGTASPAAPGNDRHTDVWNLDPRIRDGKRCFCRWRKIGNSWRRICRCGIGSSRCGICRWRIWVYRGRRNRIWCCGSGIGSSRCGIGIEGSGSGRNRIWCGSGRRRIIAYTPISSNQVTMQSTATLIPGITNNTHGSTCSALFCSSLNACTGITAK